MVDTWLDDCLAWLAAQSADLRTLLLSALGLLALQALPLAVIVGYVYVVFILPGP